MHTSKSSQEVPTTQHARRPYINMQLWSGKQEDAYIVLSCLVWCRGTVLRPNTRHAHSPTHHIQTALCTHQFTSALYPSRPF
jgi:hypothetical protein